MGFIAFLLILVNSFTPWLDPVKAKLTVVSTAFNWVTNIPSNIGGWADGALASKDDLLKENAALKEELLIHQGKLQQMFALKAENQRLQQLMNADEQVQDRIMVAKLLGISPDPLVHKVVINKGSQHGVYEGQPVLDAMGLMGQVVEVGPYSSQVLLITDGSHAMSVQVNRNGVRAVIEGNGNLYEMSLRHVPNSVDIQVGDLLVSSGLGGSFPQGHQVAVVEQVVHDPGQPFARVTARPKAQLDRSRHVLLVFSDGEAVPANPSPDEESS